MIKSYHEENLQNNLNRDKTDIQTLAYAYNILKLSPYPKVKFMSFCLNPKIVNREKFNDLQKACTHFDNIIVELLNNLPQLIQFYKDYASGDELLELLLRIYEKVQQGNNGRKKPIVYVNRHDFMFDQERDSFLQVEYNLMAASLGFHSHNVNNALKHYYTQITHKSPNFADNNYAHFHSESFVKFFDKYGNKDAYIAIVTDNEETNSFEIVQFEHCMVKSGIKTLRAKIGELKKENFSIDENNNFIFKGKEVAIVYYRYMYDPSHFVNDSEEFSVQAEISSALCIPSIESQLLNMKLNQFLLANQQLQDKYKIPRIDLGPFESHICPHFILRDNFDNDKAKMAATVEKDIDAYLLKTFREGGYGDIIGGKGIIDLISSSTEDKLNTYMLVRKIKTPIYPSHVLFEGELKYFDKTVSEFGIYTSSVIVCDEKGQRSLEWNRGTEHLIRTKPIENLKGGVAVNAAFIDSIVLE